MKEKKMFIFRSFGLLTGLYLIIALFCFSSCITEQNRKGNQNKAEEELMKKEMVYHLYSISFKEPDLKVNGYQIPNTEERRKLMNSIYIGYDNFFPDVSRLNSIIENQDKNCWYFLDGFDREKDSYDYNYKFIKIESKEKKIYIDVKLIDPKGTGMERISPDNTYFYEHSGGMFTLNTYKYQNDYYYLLSKKNIEFVEIALSIINDDLMIFQFLQDSGEELTRNSPNYIAGVSKRQKRFCGKQKQDMHLFHIGSA